MQEPVTKTWLANEWKFIVSIVTPVLAIAASYFMLRAQVDLLIYRVDKIENNHLTHIQASMEKIVDNVEALSQHEVETRTILNSHINQR